MEWAMGIPRGQALEWVEDYWEKEKNTSAKGLIKSHKRRSIIDILEEGQAQFGSVDFTRMYFGQEFCEKALPTPKEIQQALTLAKKKEMKFTLVTPYVTEEGLDKVKGLLETLVELEPHGEVVVNDWGVLQIIRESYPSLTPVLGRLLNKVLRDPRIMVYTKKSQSKQSPNNVLESYRRSSLASESMAALLKEYQVRRIELDHPPQGLDERLQEQGYDLSLYLPYGVITTGRICFIHSWELDEKEKFKTFLGGCDRKCRFYWMEMSDPGQQVPKSKDWSIVQKGNTVFYRGKGEFLRQGLESGVRAGVSRVVVQREPL